MSDNVQVTIEDLLKKIGALTVQADIYQQQMLAMKARIQELEDQLKKGEDDKK